MWAFVQAALARCVVVSGGSVFDGDDIAAADLVVVDGRIAAVGKGVSKGFADRGCDTRSAKGSVLTAGLVDPWATLGVSEVGAEKATVDHRGDGDPIRASLRPTDVYNPASVYVPIFRAGGITSAVIFPAGGAVSGQLGWVRLAGSTQEEAVVDGGIAMRFDFSGESKAASLQALRELLEDARAYKANRSAVKSGRFRSFVPGASRHDLEAMIPVVDREQPLAVVADRASDIEAAVRLAETLNIRIVIIGGAEAWKHAERLAEAEVPVLVTPMVVGPGSWGAIHARADNAAILANAGVKVMLRSGHNYNAPALRFAAGNAVRGGMTRVQAMNSITSVPAEVFGMDDRGTLEPGQVADFVVWSGDPLEIGTSVQAVYIDGTEQSLENRHTALLERYRELPGSPLAPLSVE